MRHTNILGLPSKDQGNISLVGSKLLILGSLPNNPYSTRTEKCLKRSLSLLPKLEYPWMQTNQKKICPLVKYQQEEATGSYINLL